MALGLPLDLFLGIRCALTLTAHLPLFNLGGRIAAVVARLAVVVFLHRLRRLLVRLAWTVCMQWRSLGIRATRMLVLRIVIGRNARNVHSGSLVSLASVFVRALVRSNRGVLGTGVV